MTLTFGSVCSGIEAASAAPDVLVGGTPCFTAGHVVLTEQGFKPIEDIVVGERVVTHKGRLKPVLRIGSKKAKVGTLKAIGLPRGITCTSEHPFKAVDWSAKQVYEKGVGRQVHHFSEPKWVKASDMPGKQWCTLTRYRVRAPKIETAKFTDKQAMFIAGMYLGDGYLRGWSGLTAKALILCLNDTKYALFKKIIGGITHCVVREPNGISMKVHINDTKFCNWLLEHFGELAHAKRLPPWVFNHPYKNELLQGYIATDGHIRPKDGAIEIKSTSQALAYGVTGLFNACGYVASVTFMKTPDTKIISGNVANQRDCWRVMSTKKARSRQSRYKHGYRLRSVQSFTPKGVDTVYNIEVADDHSYLIDGAVVHNCQSFMESRTRALVQRL